MKKARRRGTRSVRRNASISSARLKNGHGADPTSSMASPSQPILPFHHHGGGRRPVQPGSLSPDPEREAGRARFPVRGPPQDPRQSPRSLRNLSVYSSAVVPETELQVGDAHVWAEG